MKTFIALLHLALATSAVHARDFSAYMIDTQEELRLARTAAPSNVTDHASFYVLRDDGFALQKSGDNGWHCFVQRSFFFPREDQPDQFDTRVRAPHCINNDGAATRMQEIFLRTRLALSGEDADSVDAKVDAAYADGTLRPPYGFAMTYMMSAEQWLGDKFGAWKPHLMFWVPYLENGDTGGNEAMGDLPFIASDSGTRSAVLIVPVAPIR